MPKKIKICQKCKKSIHTNLKICFFCGYKFDKKAKSLFETNPELANELISPNPKYITAMSHKRGLWKCKKHGHKWEATIDNRTSGCGCPMCSGRQVLVGFNDLATTHPELAKELISPKPTEVKAGSNKRGLWKCKKHGHKWEAIIKSRTRVGCPMCSGLQVLVGFNDLATTHPELAKELISPKPTEVKAGSGKRGLWKCKKHGHKWEARIGDRKRSGCPICSGRQVLVGFNDLATTHPELAKELISPKPTEVQAGSDKRGLWKCKKHGHKWEATINNRTSGRGCPQCNESKLEKQTAKVLNNLNILFDDEKRFNKCRNKNPLPFDFYLPEYNTCIECQGEQHFFEAYYPMNNWGGDIKKIQKHDKIKRDFCKKEKIKLIDSITYKQRNNLTAIENILIKELNLEPKDAS